MEVLCIVSLSIILAVFIGYLCEDIVRRVKTAKFHKQLENDAFCDLMDTLVNTVSTHDDAVREINQDIDDLKAAIGALTLMLADSKEKKDEKKKK